METHVLVVEDDAEIREGVSIYLKNQGYAVHGAANGAEGLEAARRQAMHLAIVDVMMPVMDGITMVMKLRAEGFEFPVIMLSAKSEDLDKITGLNIGADDYVTKPFSLAILRARVNAQLRRGAPPQTEVFTQDGFTFDFAAMEFSKNGVSVELSKTEQKLLRLLVANRGTTLRRETLIDRVWTDGAAYVDENALSVTVKRLRGKLEDDPSHPRYLKTVYGLGYTWAAG